MANATVKFTTPAGATVELSHNAYDTVANCYDVPKQFDGDVAAVRGGRPIADLREECAEGAGMVEGQGWEEYCDAVEAEAKASKRISLNNGLKFNVAENLSDEEIVRHWDAIDERMDNDARERANEATAVEGPRTGTAEDKRAYLADYLRFAPADIVIG